MEWLALWISLLLHGSSCNASTFGYKGDPLKGGTTACTHQDVHPGQLGVAHRTLPCGTKIALYNPRTKKMVVAPVIDHGPYGALDEVGDWILKRSYTDEGKWRGCLDLTKATSDALDHNGFERIMYYPIISSSTR